MFTPKAIHAVGSESSISVEPAFQELQISQATTSATTIFRLINTTESTMQFRLLPIDIKQTDEQGNIVFVDKPSGRSYTLASFISVPSEHMKINPGERKEITVTINNSQDLSPGGHYGAVIAQFENTDDENQRILPAVSSLLFVRKIDGERFHLSLTRVSFGTQTIVTSVPKTISLTFDNQGNTHVIPRGEMKLTDLFSNTIYKGTINETSTPVLPQVNRTIAVNLRRIRPTLPLQFYTLTIRGHSTPGDIPFSHEQSFVYVSKTFLICSLLGILLVISLIGYRTRKQRKAHG